MNRFETKFANGALIEGGGGRSKTKIAVEKDKGPFYHIGAIKKGGGVAYDPYHPDEGFERMFLEDKGAEGARLFDGRDEGKDIIVEPGKVENIMVGGHELTVTGTSELGVTYYNGHIPRKLNSQRRYGEHSTQRS